VPRRKRCRTQSLLLLFNSALAKARKNGKVYFGSSAARACKKFKEPAYLKNYLLLLSI
jgi:hypothetical protein